MHQEREYPGRVVATELKQPGLRRLCARLRRLRRHGGEDRGLPQGLRGRAKIRPARDRPPQGRSQRADAHDHARSRSG